MSKTIFYNGENINGLGTMNYNSYAFRFGATSNSTAPVTANGKVTYTTTSTNFPYSTITSGGFRAPVAGLYHFSAQVAMDNNATSTFWRVGIGINSADTASITYSGAGSMDTLTWFPITNESPVASAIYNNVLSGEAYCNANDYVKVYVCLATANATKTYSWTNTTNYFSGYLIST